MQRDSKCIHTHRIHDNQSRSRRRYGRLRIRLERTFWERLWTTNRVLLASKCFLDQGLHRDVSKWSLPDHLDNWRPILWAGLHSHLKEICLKLLNRLATNGRNRWLRSSSLIYTIRRFPWQTPNLVLEPICLWIPKWHRQVLPSD